MTSFKKKINFFLPKPKNCLVVGLGFGYLSAFLETFKTVFIFNTRPLEIKSKNIIYKQDVNRLSTITDVDLISFDLNQVSYLNSIQHVWYKHRPVIIIEGREVIGRHLSLPLYKSNYRAIAQENEFHIWTYQ